MRTGHAIQARPPPPDKRERFPATSAGVYALGFEILPAQSPGKKGSDLEMRGLSPFARSLG